MSQPSTHLAAEEQAILMQIGSGCGLTVGVGASEQFDLFYRQKAKFKPESRIFVVDEAATDLERICGRAAIRQVNLLYCKVAPDAIRLSALAGRMLRHARIDAIFAPMPAPAERDGLFALLDDEDYVQYRVSGNAIHLVESAVDYGAGRALFALHRRHVDMRRHAESNRPTLDQLTERHPVTMRGAVHVGAHEGGELPVYRRYGAEAVLMIEANPAVFGRLTANLERESGVMAVNCAIADRNGTMSLHVTSFEQSSSLLTLGRHRELYPDIVEVQSIAVPTRRLDDLLADLGIPPAQVDFLALDIQGAELMALRGAENLLRQVRAVALEVNFEEIYQDCCQIEDIDNFLEARGFRRRSLICPFGPGWGDALYLRQEAR